jgi:acyl carrier protein
MSLTEPSMDVTKERVLEVIYASVREVNEQRSQNQQLTCSPDTPLGDGTALDSLSFVNFVALVEEKCEDAFGGSIVLSQAGDAPSSSDPFQTLESLAQFIERELIDRRAYTRVMERTA